MSCTYFFMLPYLLCVWPPMLLWLMVQDAGSGGKSLQELQIFVLQVSSGCRQVLTSLLAPQPAQRASLADVLSHPWFKQVGWPRELLLSPCSWCDRPNPVQFLRPRCPAAPASTQG